MCEIKNMATRHLDFQLEGAREHNKKEVKIGVMVAEDVVSYVIAREKHQANDLEVIKSLEKKRTADLHEIARLDARIEKLTLDNENLSRDLIDATEAMEKADKAVGSANTSVEKTRAQYAEIVISKNAMSVAYQNVIHMMMNHLEEK